MGLLSRKPKVSAEEFCRDFYESQIFHPIIAGADVGAVFWETVLKSVREADPSLASDDTAAFRREMTALRVELFTLAWVHHVKRDDHLLRQIVFTKSYLDHNEQSAIWHAMADYSKVIAASSCETARGERARRANITFLNKLRWDLCNKWVDAGVDVKCAAHAANLTGTNVAWSSGITQPMLIDTLVQRLEWQLNSEARFQLAAVAFGLYQGAKETIKSVQIG